MTEPITIILRNSVDFDSPKGLALEREDFDTRGRLYSVNISKPEGGISSDFFGLFSRESPKLVSVATNRWSARNVVRVVPDEATPDLFREEINLGPRLQSLLLAGGDSLVLATHEGGPVAVTLIIQDLGEADHLTGSIQSTLRVTQLPRPNRFRITRDDGSGFDPNPGNVLQSPAFTYDDGLHLHQLTENSAFTIRASDLSLAPRFEGAYVSVRFQGMFLPTGSVMLFQSPTGTAIASQIAMQNGEWSRPFFVSHDDTIGFDCGMPGPAHKVCVDIETLPIMLGDRLSGRYANAV